MAVNQQLFSYLLQEVNDEAWQALAAGANLLMIDDTYLEISTSSARNIILRGDELADVENPQQWLVDHAVELLEKYYRTTPLSRKGFDAQVARLIKQYGASSFVAVFGRLPRYSLFVEYGVVVAESADSPRHRYGVFCELDQSVPEPEAVMLVRNWLEQGEAYNRYISMNVCRYNC